MQKNCLSHIYLIFLYGSTCRRNMLYDLKCAPSATVFNALKIILIRYPKHFLMQKIESPPLGRVLESASLYGIYEEI